MVPTLGIVMILAGQATAPAASAPASAPTLTTSPAADAFLVTTWAIGIIVLTLLAIRRLIRPDLLRLERTPPRANHLGLAQALAIWLAYLLLISLVAEAARRLMGLPPRPDGEMPTEAVVLGGLIGGVLALAVALTAGHVAFERGLRRGMGLTLRRWFVDSVRGVLAGLAAFPVCAALAWLGAEVLVPRRYQELHRLLEYVHAAHAGTPWLVLGVLLAVVMAPLVEEVIFRGIIQSALRRRLGGPWPAILVTSAFFAAIHLGIHRDQTPAVRGLEVLGPLFVLSVVLGYNYERTGRLWSSIVIHAVFNAISITAALLSRTG